VRQGVASRRGRAGPGAGQDAAGKLRILPRDKSARESAPRRRLRARHLMDHAPADDTPASNLSVARQRLLILFRRRATLLPHATQPTGRPGQVRTEMDAIRRTGLSRPRDAGLV